MINLYKAEVSFLLYLVLTLMPNNLDKILDCMSIWLAMNDNINQFSVTTLHALEEVRLMGGMD